MKPCIYPKKIPVVNMKLEATVMSQFVWKKVHGYVTAPAEKKKKEKSEVFIRPRDTGSVVAAYFPFLL